jgi:allantoin racemase
MKLCYINITEEEVTRPYLAILERVFAKVLSPDTQIAIKSVKPGLRRGGDPTVPYFALLNKVQIIEKIFEAEKEGYDGAVVGCFSDPGVYEARGVVSIPVIGLCEPTLLFACVLGRRFAIVTLKEPKLFTDLELQIKMYGLEDRAILNPIRHISMSTVEVFTEGMKQPDRVAADILEKSKKCVEDGAETIIVGCNGLGPLCTVSGVGKVEEADAPILDCVSVSLVSAEAIIGLGSKLGVPYVSRAGSYGPARVKDLQRVRAQFGLQTI